MIIDNEKNLSVTSLLSQELVKISVRLAWIPSRSTCNSNYVLYNNRYKADRHSI